MKKIQKPRVIVITGAAAGVGRAAARMFAETEGAHIGLLARGREALAGAKRDVEALGGKAIILQCDVADGDAVEVAAERVERELGPIDVWVNVAMTSVFAFIKDTTPAEFKRVTEVCYLGYVHGTLAALKRMLPRDRGHIVQVGSALAYRGIPLQAAYCARKHAIEGFMDSLRAELIHQNSRIVSVMVQMPALNTRSLTGAKASCLTKPNRCRRFTSRRLRRAPSFSRREISGAKSTSGCRPLSPSSGTSFSRGWGIFILERPASKASRRARRPTRTDRTIFLNRSSAIPARTDVLMRAHTPSVRSFGRNCTGVGSPADCSPRRSDC